MRSSGPDAPFVVEEAAEYLVVYKPPGMHCAALRGGAFSDGLSLSGWAAAEFPETAALRGRGRGDGGLLHRLDFRTEGLVLIARSQRALESFLVQQRTGDFVKEYEAVSLGAAVKPPGFPPLPAGLAEAAAARKVPLVVESAFRPYGPGRKAVRPALGDGGGRGETAFDRGRPYCTEILAVTDCGGAGMGDAGGVRFALRLRRGFRHQIRCHLAWLGFPLRGDALYGGAADGAAGIGLRANGLSFTDPASGERRTCILAGETGAGG